MNTLARNTKISSEQKKRVICEQLWLSYFNDTLYEKGLITEDQRNKMRVKIKCRTTASGR